MDWIMQPISGFGSLDDAEMAAQNVCTGGSVLYSCGCDSCYVTTCACSGGLIKS